MIVPIIEDDPIIEEIRRIREKRSEEMLRDPEKYTEECNRRVRAMAIDLVPLGPHSYRATFILPARPNRRSE